MADELEYIIRLIGQIPSYVWIAIAGALVVMYFLNKL
jgi:hypothetical protein